MTRCPLYGRISIEEQTDEEKCRPNNCPAWVLEAVYNKVERRWEPIADN